MSAPRVRFLFLFVGLLLAPSARATTSNCVAATDGTACASGCISLGHCQAGICVATNLRPDGTACSSESPCTYDDRCVAGVCTAGTAVICPDLSTCLVGYCSAIIGCTLANVCLPDGGGTVDLGTPADLSGEPNDMCHIPPGAEFYVCDGDDGFYYLPFDAALGHDAGFHVRGSHVGDCAYGGDGSPGGGLVLFAVAGLLALALRPRRAASIPSSASSPS